MKKEKTNEIKLKVTEAMQDDIDRGIVRIDDKILKELGLREGDIAEIEGKTKTVGIVDRAWPGDAGLEIIRMEGIIRRNSKSNLGELVIVKKANINEAKKIVLTPAKENVRVTAPLNILKEKLSGRAIVKGDILSFGKTGKTRNLNSNSFFDEVFSSVFEDAFKGTFDLGDLKFLVDDTIPKGPVIITQNTEIILSSLTPPMPFEKSIPESKIVEIKELPDLKQYYEIRDENSFFKVEKKVQFINKYEDKKRTIYILANYYYIKENKKEQK